MSCGAKHLVVSQLAAAAAAVTLIGALVHAQGPKGPGARDDSGHLAEGFTSETVDASIEAGYRMFSLPDFKAVCDQAHAKQVTQLRALTSRVRLRIGHPFALSSLKIVALDGSGVVLPKVPIAIESELWSDVLDVRSDRIAYGTVTPLREGTIRFRIRTICDAPGAETFITAAIAGTSNESRAVARTRSARFCRSSGSRRTTSRTTSSQQAGRSHCRI
jgi:hypothetical protein